MADNTIRFSTLTREGETNVRTIRQSDIARCPFVIMVPEHYREDGSCKCDDAEHRAMMIREWGYTADDFEGLTEPRRGLRRHQLPEGD